MHESFATPANAALVGTLKDLAMHEQTFQGKFSEDNGVFVHPHWKPVGVTAQFLDNADTYHERYFQSDYWSYLIDRGTKLAGLESASGAKILDIGSGSGNTVFALARRFPAARIVASDISPQLLRILVRVAAAQGVSNVAAYCFDLHEPIFEPDSFNAVVGGAILHHMRDPAAALRHVAESMTTGALLILFEPMEVGGHMMCALYQTLLDELVSELDPDLEGFLRSMLHDYEARFGVPREKPWTADLDDKWLFSRFYLRGLAQEVGLVLEGVHALGDRQDDLFMSHLRGALSASGRADRPTPERMWEVAAQFDAGISSSLKQWMSPEAIIILRKP